MLYLSLDSVLLSSFKQNLAYQEKVAGEKFIAGKSSCYLKSSILWILLVCFWDQSITTAVEIFYMLCLHSPMTADRYLQWFANLSWNRERGYFFFTK